MFQQLNISANIPTDEEHFEAWWIQTRSLFLDSTRGNFDALVILCSWRLWKNRNAWAFGNIRQQWSVENITRSICDEFGGWAVARRRVSGVFSVRVGLG